MFDDELVFANEDEDNIKQLDGKYKVLIVDDEEQIHKITKISLENFEFNNKGLEFVSAYSAKEAKDILDKHSDIVVTLLDVVMESDEAGLEVVKYIRETLKNSITRVILRTGQPGLAPEESIIRDYDINDYKAKTELTSTKLFTTIISSIRSYENINSLLNEQKENQKRKDLLLQQSKLAMLGEMLGMITHQWRQPLSNISAIVSSALLSIKLDMMQKDEIETSLNNVGDQVQFMSNTMNDFKNFFKPNKSKQIISIYKVYEKSMKITKPLLVSSNIDLVESFESSSEINIYYNDLIQVFLNIFTNAKDVLVEKEIQNPTIYIKTYEDKSNIYIEIQDNGGGIPKENIDDIFVPYFSTKGDNGTGLGLYMSKTIIEDNLSGTIEVSNGDNGIDGANFKIILPKESK
jgi:signal transduction histidine kinase